MSASSDSTGRRPPGSFPPLQDFHTFDDVRTGPPTQVPPPLYGRDAPPPDYAPLAAEAEPSPPIYAPSRDESQRHITGTPQIVPPGSVTGRSLTLVIAIMCFLACLTAGAVYLVNQSAEAWLHDISDEVTIQIEPKDGTDIENIVKDVSLYLAGQTGVISVRALTLEENAKLLEPWLGNAEALKSLPVPRLIAIKVDRNSPPDLAAIKSTLASRFPGASLDDHRRWQQQIRSVTRSLALGGFAILLLVAAATTAIIVSATRSALASNRHIVEVLHFVGATDKFIAREFEKHFLRLGIRAGLVGAAFAMLVFFSMPAMMDILGSGSFAVTEVHRLFGAGTLDAAGYVLLAIVVFVIAALCMLTSRIGVYRILRDTP